MTLKSQTKSVVPHIPCPALKEPIIRKLDPKRAGKINCEGCSHCGYFEELKYSPLSSMRECKCTSTYEVKRYYCDAILPKHKVLIDDPKRPPKKLCPCIVKGVPWEWENGHPLFDVR